MAGKLLNMSKVKQIIRLKENGVALQTISKSLGISRNTVKKYLRLIEARNYPIQELLAKENEELEPCYQTRIKHLKPDMRTWKRCSPTLKRS